MAGCVVAAAASDAPATMLPTGKRITPLAVPGSRFELLNPGLPDLPDYRAGQAITTALSPDKQTLLLLTSGFNRVHDKDDRGVAADSNEYVFVFDVSGGRAKQKQVLTIPNTFAGIAFAPDGRHFVVSGGVDDNLHVFGDTNGEWRETGAPISLGHAHGLGLVAKDSKPEAAGVAVTADGRFALVANAYNDSVTLVDLGNRRRAAELDLRPGKIDPAQAGVAGGEYPFWVVISGNNTAYISSIRDREIDVVTLKPVLSVQTRIHVAGNPGKMILSADGSQLFVVADNSDLLSIINTAENRVVAQIPTGANGYGQNKWTGNDPNDVSLSLDGRTAYVTNGGTNSVAIISLNEAPHLVALLPAGWFPNAVALSADGRTLYVANAKTAAGPNPQFHVKVKTVITAPGAAVKFTGTNQYVYQLEKAGLQTVPIPDDMAVLERMTRQVADNNGTVTTAADDNVMQALHARIHHVIYVIKENRTYDQVLGDLGKGNGDPRLTEFGERITPNFHALARNFVDLDNFYDSGEVSGDGWPWSTSGRESDFGQKAVPLNYSDRGTAYEYEGLNREINVGLPTAKQRIAANPKTQDDPDLLPGAVNVAEPDGPAGTPQGKGYLWDAALRAGLTFREYGCMSDTELDAPRDPEPYAHHVIMSSPANPELHQFGDPYYRGFDPGYPDFYREAEWEREFNGYVANKNLPAFEIVQLPVDHMGEFATAISGVNTPETQQADNDYATAKLIERVAHSPYADDTLIFILEDDAQDGPDHVDAHRSTAYVVGPYVKHGAVVSLFYTTVSMVRTIEDVLGLQHLNLNTATTRPMTEIFDLNQKIWTFTASPSEMLANTSLPIAQQMKRTSLRPKHDAAYWAAKTRGWDFRGEDRVDSRAFNRLLWEGLMDRTAPLSGLPQ